MSQMPKAAPLHRLLLSTADALLAVRQGRSLSPAIAAVPPHLRSGCQALSFHVMRHLGSAEFARQQLAPKAPPADVDALLTVALALLWPAAALPYEPHTLVNEAVKAARVRAARSSGFVNAVLRNFLRQSEALHQAAQTKPVARWNHPVWWQDRLRSDWPVQAGAVMEAAQQHPPMTLRRNTRHGPLKALLESRGECKASQASDAAPANLPAGHPAVIPASALQGLELKSMGWQAKAITSKGQTLPQGWSLEKPLPVSEISGFSDGDWSVQDAAAQWAAPLLLQSLEAQSSGRLRVLDACSAPGGKTAHLLESADLELWALDSDLERLNKVRDTLNRLKLPAAGSVVQLQAADARQTDRWWDGQPFDAILLDAPCSGSGIVRRHPDARWLRRASDIAALAQLQAELLDALWPLLRPGGRLLYATCSVFKAEGQHQIDAFLQRQGLSTAVVDPLSPGHVLPLVDNHPHEPGAHTPVVAPCDGFFYALLHKP